MKPFAQGKLNEGTIYLIDLKNLRTTMIIKLNR